MDHMFYNPDEFICYKNKATIDHSASQYFHIRKIDSYDLWMNCSLILYIME